MAAAAQRRAVNKPREDRRSLGGTVGGVRRVGSLGRSVSGLGSGRSISGSVSGISSAVESVVRMGCMGVGVELFFLYTLLSLSHPTNTRDVEGGGKSCGMGVVGSIGGLDSMGSLGGTVGSFYLLYSLDPD